MRVVVDDPHSVCPPHSMNRQAVKRNSTSFSSRLQLTSRDDLILSDCFKYQVLTTRQITSLHFSSISRARRRLRKLWFHKLLNKTNQMGDLRIAMAEHIYYPSSTCKRILSQRNQNVINGIQPVGFSRGQSYMQLSHSLERNQFVIDFIKLCQDMHGISAVGWQHGKHTTLSNERVYTLRNGQMRRHTIIPDAVIECHIGRILVTLYLEIDRGTMPLKRISDKLMAYSVWWQHCILADQTKLNHSLCILVNKSPKRLQNIRTLANKKVTRNCRQRMIFAENAREALETLLNSELLKRHN